MSRARRVCETVRSALRSALIDAMDREQEAHAARRRNAELAAKAAKAEAKAAAQARGAMPKGTTWRQSASAFSDVECANAGNLPKMTKGACQLKCLAEYPRCTAVNFHVDLGCVLRACVSAKAPAAGAAAHEQLAHTAALASDLPLLMQLLRTGYPPSWVWVCVAGLGALLPAAVHRSIKGEEWEPKQA